MTPELYADYLIDNTGSLEVAIFCCNELISQADTLSKDWYQEVQSVLESYQY